MRKLQASEFSDRIINLNKLEERNLENRLKLLKKENKTNVNLLNRDIRKIENELEIKQASLRAINNIERLKLLNSDININVVIHNENSYISQLASLGLYKEVRGRPKQRANNNQNTTETIASNDQNQNQNSDVAQNTNSLEIINSEILSEIESKQKDLLYITRLKNLPVSANARLLSSSTKSIDGAVKRRSQSAKSKIYIRDEGSEDGKASKSSLDTQIFEKKPKIQTLQASSDNLAPVKRTKQSVLEVLVKSENSSISHEIDYIDSVENQPERIKSSRLLSNSKTQINKANLLPDHHSPTPSSIPLLETTNIALPQLDDNSNRKELKLTKPSKINKLIRSSTMYTNSTSTPRPPSEFKNQINKQNENHAIIITPINSSQRRTKCSHLHAENNHLSKASPKTNNS